MKIAITGFSGCGKSTCFKAIAQKKKDETEKLDPTKQHLIAVKIEDVRLDKLGAIFKPKKTTHAEIIFVDLPGFHISQIKEMEAVMGVLGMFSGRDPAKDMEDMDIEFMLADLEIINHRLPGIEKELKQDKSAEKQLERGTLIKAREFLEKTMPLRDLALTIDEEKGIRGFQFVSRKPLFFLANISEIGQDGKTTHSIEAVTVKKNFRYAKFCAKLESEIVDLADSERESFLKELDIEKSASQAVIELAYEALGYVTFFTVKGSETKAWPVKKGIKAIEAAGEIHSDIQKGFIKAEVVNIDNLTACGSLAEAKKKAFLRLESKEYIVQDGDVIDFKFNV